MNELSSQHILSYANILGVCFLTKAELADKQEYQRVAFPLTVPEMIKIEQSKKKAKQDSIEAREAYISKNLLKLGQWKKDIIARQLKRETVSTSQN